MLFYGEYSGRKESGLVTTHKRIMWGKMKPPVRGFARRSAFQYMAEALFCVPKNHLQSQLCILVLFWSRFPFSGEKLLGPAVRLAQSKTTGCAQEGSCLWGHSVHCGLSLHPFLCSRTEDYVIGCRVLLLSLGTHELWLCQKVLCSVGGTGLTEVSQCFRQESLILFILKDAWGWCTGTTQRDGMGREEGGGFRMENTCIPVADSF